MFGAGHNQKECSMLKTLIPGKTKAEPSPRGGELTPLGDFPFSLSRMREEFDRMLDRVAREFTAFPTFRGEGWRWGLEVEDEDDAIILRAEAPGFEPGDFDLRVEDGRLVLRASKKVETKGEKGEVKEYREQECYETVALPSGIDKEKVDAKYHNGVLTVTLPKTPEGKPKRIAVKAAE
jgi:HSP20 family protein